MRHINAMNSESFLYFDLLRSVISVLGVVITFGNA